MKKKIICLFLLICLFELSSLSVFAYRPTPYLCIETTRNDIPKNTAYIDLLLPIQENDKNFVMQKDETNTVINIFDYSSLQLPNNCEIANYNNAYYSYHFHFNNSTISVLSMEDDNHIYIDYGENQRLLEDYLLKIDSFRIAFVDDQGCIIKISNSVSAKSPILKSFSNLIIANEEVSEVYMDSPYSSVYICILLLCVIIICIIIIRERQGKTGDGSLS